MMKSLIPIFLLMWGISFAQTPRTQKVNPNPEPMQWQLIDHGLEYTEAEAGYTCNLGDSKITLVRVDPEKFDFRLLSVKELGGNSLTAEKWVRNHKLVLAINAGMYLTDFQTNVGFMKNYDFTNNSRLNKDNTIVAFNPKSDELPPFQIIDRQCQDWETLKNQYYSFTQSIRMIDCNQNNKWSRQEKFWSIAAIAMDKDGKVIFAHSRTPWSVHDFSNFLLTLPLDIHNAMYLEGGPEASLYLNYNGFEITCIGSYESGFYLSDDNHHFWPIPNVIGVVQKP